MKALLTIFVLSIGTLAFGQCDQLNTVKKDFTVTTTTPTKIKEFSISKIWFSDYTPPASLIYLFLHTDGEYLDHATLKELSVKNNLIIHFTDSSTLELRVIIESNYSGEDQYHYHTVVFLSDDYIQQLTTKTVSSFDLFSFKTKLSDRKGKKLYDYMNCMISNEN